MRGRLHTSRSRRWALAVGAALWLALGAADVKADVTDANRTAAEALFGEARKLMAEENYAEACPKLADSHRLDPGIGTLLNLGLCYKHAGKTASAWSAYREAAAMARAARQPTREDVAQREADELEPHLSKVTIQVDPATAEAGADIKLDGASIPRSLWNVPMPVDPGEHGVQATAEGKLPWSTRFEVGERATQALEIPALADEPVVDEPTKPEPETTPAPAPTPPPSEPHDGGLTGQQIAAVIVGGVGLAGIAVGTVFGLSAKGALDDSASLCSTRNVCTQEGIDLRDDAGSKAALATIAYGVGLAGLGGAAVLWFTSPTRPEGPQPGEQVAVSAAVTPGVGGTPWSLSVRGNW